MVVGIWMTSLRQVEKCAFERTRSSEFPIFFIFGDNLWKFFGCSVSTAVHFWALASVFLEFFVLPIHRRHLHPCLISISYHWPLIAIWVETTSPRGVPFATDFLEVTLPRLELIFLLLVCKKNPLRHEFLERSVSSAIL